MPRTREQLEMVCVRKNENEPPVGVGGSQELLLWNLQVHTEPVSHAKEPGLYLCWWQRVPLKGSEAQCDMGSFVLR